MGGLVDLRRHMRPRLLKARGEMGVVLDAGLFAQACDTFGASRTRASCAYCEARSLAVSA